MWSEVVSYHRSDRSIISLLPLLLGTMLQQSILLLLLSFLSCISAFQLQQSTTICIATHKRYPQTYLQATKDDSGGDNKAMAFLRKKGRVGGAANMDFANVVGPDESPGGGKQAHKEDGFQVSKMSTKHMFIFWISFILI